MIRKMCTGNVADFHLTFRDFRGFQLEQTAYQVGMGTGNMNQRTAVCLVNLQNVHPDQVAFLVLLAGNLLGGTEHCIGNFVAGADTDEHVAGGGVDPQHGAGQQLLCLGGVGFEHHAPLRFPDALDDHLLGSLGSDAAELLDVDGNCNGVTHIQVGIGAACGIHRDLQGQIDDLTGLSTYPYRRFYLSMKYSEPENQYRTHQDLSDG